MFLSVLLPLLMNSQAHADARCVYFLSSPGRTAPKACDGSPFGNDCSESCRKTIQELCQRTSDVFTYFYDYIDDKDSSKMNISDEKTLRCHEVCRYRNNPVEGEFLPTDKGARDCAEKILSSDPRLRQNVASMCKTKNQIVKFKVPVVLGWSTPKEPQVEYKCMGTSYPPTESAAVHAPGPSGQ